MGRYFIIFILAVFCFHFTAEYRHPSLYFLPVLGSILFTMLMGVITGFLYFHLLTYEVK